MTGILVVEHEPIVAIDICESIMAAGWAVVGPYYTVTDAMASAESEALQGAIVDTWLSDGTTQGVIDALSKRSIPVVIAAKPFQMADVLRSLAARVLA